MAITDRTRKILWGRSGNRCALCRKELIMEATKADDESVIGEECHIVSSKEKGPRYQSDFPRKNIDQYENLILLCRNDHKKIDDQTDTYLAELLHEAKVKHENWVASSLDNPLERNGPIKIKRVKQNIPSKLPRISTGKDLLKIVMNAQSFSFDHEEFQTEEDAGLVGAFLQNLQDWGDLSSDLESGEITKLSFTLSQDIKELEKAGFIVFGGREVQILQANGTESNWTMAIINILYDQQPEPTIQKEHPVYLFSKLAQKWNEESYPYYLIESLDKKLQSFLRHPTLESKDLENGYLDFMMVAAIHYGGNWCYWVKNNSHSPHRLNQLVKVLNISYDRVRFRILFALQLFEQETIEKEINDTATILPEGLIKVLHNYVYTKTVNEYLSKLKNGSDVDLSKKSSAVMREIAQFGEVLTS